MSDSPPLLQPVRVRKGHAIYVLLVATKFYVPTSVNNQYFLCLLYQLRGQVSRLIYISFVATNFYSPTSVAEPMFRHQWGGPVRISRHAGFVGNLGVLSVAERTAAAKACLWDSHRLSLPLVDQAP